MKKVLFLIFIFCALEANAQSYYITFAGAGASSVVNSVKVENLTAGTSLTLNGSDILHLAETTGINSVENGQSFELKVFPNPSMGISRLQVYPPLQGNAVITLFDITGKHVAQIKSYLENYLQEFQLSGLNNGLYLISVNGKTYHYSGKLLSNSNTDGNIVSIKRISSTHAVDKKQLNKEDKGSQAMVEMAYTMGDRVKFTGISGNYSTVVTDIPSSDKTITFNFIACSDGDNINYPVVSIGTQIWMAEDLKTIKYRNGDLIGTTSPYYIDISGETSPKYQWAYDGNESNVATYGRLYTYYAITDIRNVCPTGWHVPTDGQWTIMENYLIANSYNYDGTTTEDKIAKSLASTALWAFSPTIGAVGNTDYPTKRNATGFTALPGGYRPPNGSFNYILTSSFWWSSTETSSTYAWSWGIGNEGSRLDNGNSGKKSGFSVRCLKDDN